MPRPIGNWCDGHGEHVQFETRSFLFPQLNPGRKVLCSTCFWLPLWQERFTHVKDKVALEMIDHARVAWAESQQPVSGVERLAQIDKELARLIPQQERTENAIKKLLDERLLIEVEIVQRVRAHQGEPPEA